MRWLSRAEPVEEDRLDALYIGRSGQSSVAGSERVQRRRGWIRVPGRPAGGLAGGNCQAMGLIFRVVCVVSLREEALGLLCDADGRGELLMRSVGRSLSMRVSRNISM